MTQEGNMYTAKDKYLFVEKATKKVKGAKVTIEDGDSIDNYVELPWMVAMANDTRFNNMKNRRERENNKHNSRKDEVSEKI